MSTEFRKEDNDYSTKELDCYEIKSEKNFHFNEAGRKNVSKFKIIWPDSVTAE